MSLHRSALMAAIVSTSQCCAKFSGMIGRFKAEADVRMELTLPSKSYLAFTLSTFFAAWKKRKMIIISSPDRYIVPSKKMVQNLWACQIHNGTFLSSIAHSASPESSSRARSLLKQYSHATHNTPQSTHSLGGSFSLGASILMHENRETVFLGDH